ncbi:hypothetical protein DL546_000909 [Coniochaeta pulveracea]|uniref:Uncharacterized protein n=1 Tax=Coniochaeta pulveracea TaxID=177199 RepID=A0A420XXV5_9PEZI|nr:hypothetical protein DL546_000909 [Coniochaeta pulveracea]
MPKYLCLNCDTSRPCQHDLAAMRGIRLPPDLTDCCLPCVVYGIRSHEVFARSKEVEELCATSEEKAFARARNARLIMSNDIPNMESDHVKPYCVWYPDIASEDTYRELVKTYPDMAYTVGRACAVAGYDKLYQELDILPEVSIAEEAKDNASSNGGSKAIFDHIMRQPVCYAVLDDYTRKTNLDNPSCPAFMNGDTAVRSLLGLRVGVDKYEAWSLAGGHYFDIVEDSCLTETVSEAGLGAIQPLPEEYDYLMYTPLPPHLPVTAKDALILMAAYEGNLDRYTRLRRPKMIEHETKAVIRGVYHNTTFAKYWSRQTFPLKERMLYGLDEIKRATIARFIMVNDLSQITPTDPAPNSMPGMIWWPLLPAEETLRELVRRRPDMRLQAAMTCIEANYELLWDELAPEPRWELWKLAQRQFKTDARHPVRSYYTDYLERREAETKEAAEVGDEDPVVKREGARSPPYYGPSTIGHDLCEEAARVDREPTTTLLVPGIYAHWLQLDASIYAHQQQLNLAGWELYICSSEEMRRRARDEGWFYVFNEDDYPPSLYPRHYPTRIARKQEDCVKADAQLQGAGSASADHSST